MVPEFCMDALGDRGRLEAAYDSEDAQHSDGDMSHHGFRIMQIWTLM